jgi:hypothetical protein
MSHPPLYLCPHMKTKATTKKKPPAVTRENGRPTINAEAVDDLFMVDAACDRWLKRRAELRRKRDERLADKLPAVHPLVMIVIVIIEGNNDGGAA